MTERRALRWTLVGVGLLALILVPFVLFEAELNAWAEGWLESSGARGLVAVAVVLLLVLDVLLPIPSSFVSGASVAALGPGLGGAAIWLGLSGGAALGYALGKVGGRGAVRTLVGERELERAERLASRFGTSVLVVSRGVPVLAEASALLAGALALPLGRFALVVGASNLGLALAYALVASFAASLSGASFLLPFALGILVPALALLALRRAEKRA